MTDKTQLLPVTQADRDAASDLVSALYHRKCEFPGYRDRATFVSGEADADHFVQAFARHRISHSLPGDEEAEKVAAWLEQYPTPLDDLDMAMRIRQICAAIRAGEHRK